LLCMPFDSKLWELHMDNSWFHFLAAINFTIIADKFRKKKTFYSIQKSSSYCLLSNMSYARAKQTRYACNYIFMFFFLLELGIS
jgi:hypothetical protein